MFIFKCDSVSVFYPQIQTLAIYENVYVYHARTLRELLPRDKIITLRIDEYCAVHCTLQNEAHKIYFNQSQCVQYIHSPEQAIRTQIVMHRLGRLTSSIYYYIQWHTQTLNIFNKFYSRTSKKKIVLFAFCY